MVLDSSNDAASFHWGSTWRMPTYTECEWLVNPDNCDWQWTDDYNDTGVAGRIVTSKVEGYKGNSIFLPATGSMINTWHSTGYGGYWSSSRYKMNPLYAWKVFFNSEKAKSSFDSERYLGYPVRPVSE